MKRLSPIQQGKFGYAECFEAFVRGDANGQKHQTQHIVEALTRALREEGVVFTGEGTIDILDVGCGPGLYAKMFLTSIGKAYPGKIHYHGVDINPAFVKAAKKEVASLPNVSQADVVLAAIFAEQVIERQGRARAETAKIGCSADQVYSLGRQCADNWRPSCSCAAKFAGRMASNTATGASSRTRGTNASTRRRSIRFYVDCIIATSVTVLPPRRHCQVEPFRPRWGATGSASCGCGRGAPLRSRI